MCKEMESSTLILDQAKQKDQDLSLNPCVTNKLYFFVFIFQRARVSWPLLCLCRAFMIFEGCLDLNKLYSMRLLRPDFWRVSNYFFFIFYNSQEIKMECRVYLQSSLSMQSSVTPKASAMQPRVRLLYDSSSQTKQNKLNGFLVRYSFNGYSHTTETIPTSFISNLRYVIVFKGQSIPKFLKNLFLEIIFGIQYTAHLFHCRILKTYEKL